MRWLAIVLLSLPVVAGEPAAHPSRFGAGEGPRCADGQYRLLDEARTAGQSNAIAFDVAHAGARESLSLRCRLRVEAGGDGGAILFLSTGEYGARGPAPFVRSWVEPNLRGTFAVGFDVHNPPSEEMFGPWGNYQGLPEREVSLHWDGREIVKRVAPAEFRGASVACEVSLEHVCGGAEVTVRVAGETVYDRFFVPGLLPYEARLALGAGTRADATTRFDIDELRFEAGAAAATPRPPVHVEVFNHVLTNNAKTAYEAEAPLPPADWAFGRVILTLEIHDAGKDWDEWDRCGEVSVFDAEGNRRGIVPFITSYRTPCRWQVDVTHFRPLLAGKTRFEVAAGTNFYMNRGYMMSVSLDFHHGTPRLEPFRAVPLWHGTAHYRSAENHFRDFFGPRTVAIDAETKAARLFVTTTGHSQVGEFTPARRALIFRAAPEAAEQRFENLLWKADCYLNPNRPQFGTWKFARAGWAPGDLVRPWWIDLTGHLRPGATAELRYEPSPYEFPDPAQAPPPNEVNAASHNVRAYLILYREPRAPMAAPVLFVTGVANDSSAAKAGIRQGDYLASYDGKRLDSVEDLRAAIAGALDAKRARVRVVVYRGAERIEVDVDPGRLGVQFGGR